MVNLDALRYSGNLDNLRDVASNPCYRFVHGDICDAKTVEGLIKEHHIDTIANFAAETHVDRSILEPAGFVRTDVIGTAVLLEAARTAGVRRFLQVSTDEVYGNVSAGRSKESDPLTPRSPYAASQSRRRSAGSELLHHLRSASFDHARQQHLWPEPISGEKFIPLFVTNALEDQALPLYGDGLQQRDWIYWRITAPELRRFLNAGHPEKSTTSAGAASGVIRRWHRQFSTSWGSPAPSYAT